MGSNPNRKKESQKYHNEILEAVAKDMKNRGYHVKVDHISWEDGSPHKIGNHIPDLIATSDNKGNFIMEVENSTTYSDEYTYSQLKDFAKSKKYTTYIIIPKRFEIEGELYNSVQRMKTLLQEWGLNNIKIGTYDWDTKTLIY